MDERMTQEQRLDFLVEEFKADSGEYRNLQTPADPEGKRRVLRSLMNIRMPRTMAARVLAVQDEYLTKRSEEKGIVKLKDIPVIRNRMSIWQGGYHTACSRCHSECGKLADARMLCSHAQLHRQLHSHLCGNPAEGGVCQEDG